MDNYGREKDDEYGLRKKIEFTCQESENCVSVQEDIVDLGRFEVKSRTSKGQEVKESMREALSSARQQESGTISPRFNDSVCIFERLPL